MRTNSGMKNVWNVAMLGLVLIGGAVGAQAGTKVWLATGTNDWWTGSNWTDGTVPQAGDNVVITNAGAGVILSNAAPASGSFATLVIGNTASIRTSLIFTNWSTTLGVTDMTIASNGIVTCAGPFTNAPDMSNRVYVVCSSLTVQPGGAINVNARGYRGGIVGSPNGAGPGGGTGGGAGYGGRGGETGAGNPYGSADLAAEPGSGGALGTGNGVGAHGGGCVRIEASGAVVINGSINADGGSGTGGHARGGSGGGIFINCNTVDGTGAVTANGGSGVFAGDGYGGGGRIAVIYQTGPQSLLAVPALRFSAAALPVDFGGRMYYGDLGTLYFPDNRLLQTTIIPHSGRWMVPNATNIVFASSVIFTNACLRFDQAGTAVNVANDLTISGANAQLMLGGNTNWATGAANYTRVRYQNTPGTLSLSVGGNLLITNSASLFVAAAPTNAAGPEYGALVAITGAFTVAAGCTVYPQAHFINGSVVKFTAANVAVQATGAINADVMGYGGGISNSAPRGYGPGGGYIDINAPGAGSHGGVGSGGGPAYGDPARPTEPGSGGAGTANQTPDIGLTGGGCVWIEAANQVVVNGTISANAGGLGGENRRGGAAGGGVYIKCATFQGSNGVVRADAYISTANFYSGGGGGRIAVEYNTVAQAGLPVPTVTFSAFAYSASASVGYLGDLGTLWFPDNRFLATTVLPHSGRWVAPNATNLVFSSLLITNGQLRFDQPGTVITVSNDLRIAGANAQLMLGGDYATTTDVAQTHGYYLRDRYTTANLPPTLCVGGDLTITNGGSMYVAAGWTNSAVPGYGALVAVTGRLDVATNCTLYLRSHPTNGASVKIQAGALTLRPGSLVDATYRGYAGNGSTLRFGWGPGGGASETVGGSYGGRGGGASAGAYYGSITFPTAPGSAGGVSATAGDCGGAAGGAVWFDISGTAVVSGVIAANGKQGWNRGAGGAGGGVLIVARRLEGAGTISANGGLGANGTSHGNGGGGRVALDYVETAFAGSVAVAGPYNVTIPAQSGQTGTLYACRSVVRGAASGAANGVALDTGLGLGSQSNGMWLARTITAWNVEKSLIWQDTSQSIAGSALPQTAAYTLTGLPPSTQYNILTNGVDMLGARTNSNPAGGLSFSVTVGGTPCLVEVKRRVPGGMMVIIR